MSKKKHTHDSPPPSTAKTVVESSVHPTGSALPPGEVVKTPPTTPGEDVNIGIIVRFGIGLALVVVLVAALLVVFMHLLRKHEASEDPIVPPLAQHELGRAPAGVRLQEHPFRDLEQLRTEEAARLDEYAWVDPKAGVVRIPIDLAMQRLVSRGLPVRGAASAAPAAVPTGAGPVAAAKATPAASPKPRAARTAATAKPAAPGETKP
jgi:hypothetical protein